MCVCVCISSQHMICSFWTKRSCMHPSLVRMPEGVCECVCVFAPSLWINNNWERPECSKEFLLTSSQTAANFPWGFVSVYFALQLFLKRSVFFFFCLTLFKKPGNCFWSSRVLIVKLLILLIRHFSALSSIRSTSVLQWGATYTDF